MRETHTNPETNNGDGYYEIRLKGLLDDRGASWFEEMAITQEDSGDTLLTGRGIDQAALHGLLKRIRNLGIPLLSVNFTTSGPAQVQEDKR